MENAELISLGSLFVSAASFIVAFFAFRRAAKVAADSAQAGIFLSIDRDLAAARSTYLNRFQDFITAQNDKKSSEQSTTLKQALLLDAKETFCNVIDNSCAQYIDGRLDKNRFKKMYCDAFREHVRHSDFSDKYTEGTRYQSTLKCIREWNPAYEG